MLSSVVKPLSSKIAEVALAKFDELPQKCKPRTWPDGSREWTPLSAIVLAHGVDQECLTCVCLATGTKCLPALMIPTCQGSVLHDSHAEVLALRAFNHWLLSELKRLLQDHTYTSDFLCIASNIDSRGSKKAQDSTDCRSRLFKIKDSVSIHLFTTEAPCGDASMELLMRSMEPKDAVPWPVSETDVADGLPLLHGRGHFSILGAVRRKPSRADAQPTLSKSCTDKLALKQFLSVLSFPTDLFITKSPESFLKSVVVYSHQFDEVSYSRAFSDTGRCASSPELPAKNFDINVLPSDFPRFRYEKIQGFSDAKSLKQKASNVSAVWISGALRLELDVVEILLNGVKQGYQRLDTRRQRESTLCRQQMWKLANEVRLHFPEEMSTNQDSLTVSKSLDASSYAFAKNTPLRRQRNLLKDLVVDHFGNWEKNKGDDEWEISVA